MHALSEGLKNQIEPGPLQVCPGKRPLGMWRSAERHLAARHNSATIDIHRAEFLILQTAVTMQKLQSLTHNRYRNESLVQKRPEELKDTNTNNIYQLWDKL